MTSKQLREMDSQRAKGQGTESKSITSSPTGVDFSFIIDKASDVLTQKSKDLRVASYLCLALWRRDGFQGLEQGLAAVLILVRTFWEGMFPAKARIVARKNTIDFLTQRLSDGLREAGLRQPIENRSRMRRGSWQSSRWNSRRRWPIIHLHLQASRVHSINASRDCQSRSLCQRKVRQPVRPRVSAALLSPYQEAEKRYN